MSLFTNCQCFLLFSVFSFVFLDGALRNKTSSIVAVGLFEKTKENTEKPKKTKKSWSAKTDTFHQIYLTHETYNPLKYDFNAST